jgi:transposase
MTKKDARKLTTEAQHLIRIQAVDMVFKHNLTMRKAAKILGVSRQHVGKWCEAFEAGGYDALELGRRGRKPGACQKLEPNQCATVVRIITDNTPDQLKMEFLLWERVAVRKLVFRKFGVVLALRTISDYLKRWGMTPQKPVKQSYEQNEKQVNEWLDVDYPKIREQAKREGAEIFWADETGVQNSDNRGRSFAPKGKTPVIKKPGKRVRVNMISAVTNKGHVRFMVYSDKMNQQKLITFFKRLIKSTKGKVFVIMDNLKVHHGKILKEWASDNSDEIELFYIPSYAPELNPDEYLNRDLKKNVNNKGFAKNLDKLKKNLNSFMRSIQKQPHRVISYFNSSGIRYAKA